MFFFRKPKEILSFAYSTRERYFIHKSFQLKVIFQFLFAVSVGLLAVAPAVFYFIPQNYKMFIEMAYQQNPEMIPYLEKELVSFYIYFSFVSLFALSFFAFWGLRFSSQLIGPIRVLQNHIKRLSRGIWFLGPVRVRKSDAFHDLIEDYNYFYRSLQKKEWQDLELLQKMQDVDHKEFFKLRGQILLAKRRRLGLEPHLEDDREIVSFLPQKKQPLEKVS
ncbi:MAG: hypothetical protein D6797_02120 [Bdellovibrio sp.]|nr:MAG: hypothetical protein D6797_02120 [Bdellovibrio sp.]